MKPPVIIRCPEPGDEGEFITRAISSRCLHRPWVTAPTSPEQFLSYITRMQEPANHGFLVCTVEQVSIAGVINLTNVVLGPFRSGYLGYYAFAGFEGRGFMRAGLQQVVRHAFKSLKLHRMEANIRPENKASIELVKSCGFSNEGYSPKYLKIGGRWRDHERWAILAS